MRSSCRTHQPSVAAYLTPFVDTLDDALFAIDASASAAPFGSMALLLDGDDRLITVVTCSGCEDVTHLVDFSQVLLSAAAKTGAWRSTILATDRAATGLAHDPDDTETWDALCRAFDGSGVDLVDWLLVDGTLVRSMGETVDGIGRW